jgi:glycolate oxidase
LLWRLSEELAMSIPLAVPDASILEKRESIIRALLAFLPHECVISAEDERRAFDTDGLTSYRAMPLAVVLPTTTEQVSNIMRLCHDQGIKVVARGAGTSLCGGAIPAQDAIVLGLAKMNAILEVRLQDRAAHVQAGVTNLAISGAVAHEDFFYAPDPSSQLACTIAGNIAMNSGGAHCLKYGVTTNNLLGVTLVLEDGTVTHIGGPYCDAPTLDLLGLICGSEGQLGIVTEAWVRLLHKPEGARPCLFGFDSAQDAGACVAAIIGAGIVPVALEYMDRPAIKVCEAFAHAGYPLDVEALLIVEVEGSVEEIDAQLDKIVAIAKGFNPKAIKVSQSETESAAIWKGRKSAFGATGRIADYICMDGTIPTGQLPLALKRIDEIVASYGLGVANVFHAGDGNLHPLVMFNASVPGEMEKAEEAGLDILRLCVELGGCLTGEHGVGIEKRDLMRCQFTDADLEQQMRVRRVFDPDERLNPGKVFPLDMKA